MVCPLIDENRRNELREVVRKGKPVEFRRKKTLEEQLSAGDAGAEENWERHPSRTMLGLMNPGESYYDYRY